jgi:hypothetical protein
MYESKNLHHQDIYFNPYEKKPNQFGKRRKRLRKKKSLEKSKTRIFNGLTLLIFSLSLGGFCYQIYDLCDSYFKYETSSLLEIDINDDLYAPDLSLCMRYVDILSMDLSYEERHTKLGIRSVQRNLTIEQIFGLTPKPSELLSECFHRKPGSYQINELKTNSQCRMVFNITKFYLQEYICYRFHIKGGELKQNSYSYKHIAFSLSYSGLFFGVSLNQSVIQESNQCKIIVHESDTYPVDSAAYAPFFYRRINDNESKYDMIKADYAITEIDLLPPPYDTGCDNYTKDGEMKKFCINRCVKNKAFDSFGKAAFTVVEDQPVDLKHISGEDLENETLESEIKAIEKGCDSECFRPACSVEYSTTRIQKEERGVDSLFSLIVTSPGSPSVTVRSVPRQSFRDFAIYVTSTFGTWFGLSVMSFNPEAMRSLIERKGKKKKKSQVNQMRLVCHKCRILVFRIKQEILFLRRLVMNYGLSHNKQESQFPRF